MEQVYEDPADVALAEGLGLDAPKETDSEMTEKIPVKSPKKRFKIDLEEIYGTAFAAVPLIGFLIFGAIPLVLAFAMAFLDIPGYSIDGAEWAGFDNFVYIFEDPLFGESILNTIILGASTFISQIFALAIAYLLSRDIKGRGIWRIIYFIPYVCSVVAITLMWRNIFNPSFGIINQILGKGGLGNGAINWLGEPGLYYVTVIIMSVWSGMGYGILLYSAALTNVNQSSIEAAKIDGAGPFTQFFRIVLPSVSPTTFYLLIMGVIGLLQAFAVTNVLTPNGGPDNQGVTIVFYMYRYIMEYDGKMGVASAAAWVLTALILAVTGLQFLGSRRWVKYD